MYISYGDRCILTFYFKFLLNMNMNIAQSCPTLCDPMDYRVHGILQARILEWVAFSFSRGSSQPRDQAHSLPAEPQGKPTNTGVGSLSLLQGIFSTQELNWGFLHCRQILCQLSHKGSPNFYWSIADLQGCINFRSQQSESVMHLDGSTFF